MRASGSSRVGARIGAATVLIAAAVAVAAPAAAGPSGGALPPQLIQVLKVAGRHGVPADATMVAANVTVVGPAEPGFVTVYACDGDEPETSNVNYLTDQVVPNLVLSRVSAEGTICIATAAVTDVIVDLVGYVPAGSSVHPLEAPVRRLDTRAPGGPPSPLPANRVTEVAVAGRDGIPADADVVVFNATAIGGAEAGFLTAYPCGDRPSTSSVNYLPRGVVPNLVVSKVSAAGSICIFNKSEADVIVDLAAYATDGITPLRTPKRIADTRTDGVVDPAGEVLRLDVAGRSDVPDDATAAVYNLTSVDATGLGYATSYPCDVPRPTVSNLNYAPGTVTSNGAITKLSAAGELCIYHLAATNLVVDLVGYTRDTTHYAPVTPKRILDTRDGWQRTCDWVVKPHREDDSKLVAFNLRDGRTLTVRLPDGGVGRVMRAAVDRACAGVWVARDHDGTGGFGLFHLGFDGSRERQRIGKRIDNGEYREMPNGEVWLITVYGRLVRLPEGSAVQDHSVFPTGMRVDDRGYRINAVAMSDDGTLFAAVYTNSRSHMLGVYTRDGVQVSLTPFRGLFRTVDVSPRGTYVVVNTTVDGGATNEATVYTLFGDVVDRVTSETWEYVLEPAFVGEGELVLCARAIGLFRWQLYGPLDQLIPFAHPFFPEREGSCDRIAQ